VISGGRERTTLAVLFVVISLWAMISQKPARLIADGTQYHSMAMQYGAGARVVTAEGPFVARIATPWLASRLDPLVRGFMPNGLELIIEEANGLKGFPGFYAVNILASIAATILLYRYVRVFVHQAWLRLLLMTLWVIQWHGPVRFTYFYPAHVDPLFVAALFGGLLVVERSRATRLASASVAVLAITFVATLCRETALLIPLMFGVRHWRTILNPARPGDRLWLLLPGLGWVLALLIVRALTVPDRPYDPLAAPAQMLREKPFFTWLLAWFFAFGPVTIAVIIAGWRRVRETLRQHPHFVLYLVVCGDLAFFGGTDTERILVWAWPVVLVLLGAAIDENAHVFARNRALTAILCGIALVSARIFWSIPAGVDDATPTAALDVSPASLFVILDKTIVINNYYSNLWSFFGSRAVHAAQLAFDLILTAGMVAMIRRLRAHSSR
jgi:hypothetical protein